MDLKKSLSACNSIISYDTHITSKLFGFEHVDDYYDKCSCYHALPKVRIPMFILMAKDDPIVGPQAICYNVS